jgi:hypothetical protein
MSTAPKAVKRSTSLTSIGVEKQCISILHTHGSCSACQTIQLLSSPHTGHRYVIMVVDLVLAVIGTVDTCIK